MPYYDTINLKLAKEILEKGCAPYDAYRLLESFVAEITHFHQLFSDYEEPCASYEQAEAIWNALKGRETRLHDEITRLRSMVASMARVLDREAK